MDCNEALELLYLSFEGQITPSQQVALNAHRRTCFACSAKLVKAEKFQYLIQRVPQLTVPRGLEERILAHVAANAGIVTTPKPQVAWTFPKWELPKLSFGGVLAMGGVLAAAVVVFFVANSFIKGIVPTAQQGGVLAMIHGSLEATSPTGGGVLNSGPAIQSGAVVRNVSSKPAIVAFSPNMVMRFSPNAQVHFGSIYVNKSNGQITVSNAHLDSGTVSVREHLHRDAAPIHIATNLATFVPIGTMFAVTALSHSTSLAVVQGKVTVYLAHRTFTVSAGRSIKILANDGVLWNKPPTPKTTKG